jgi:DNA-binding protein Fis
VAVARTLLFALHQGKVNWPDGAAVFLGMNPGTLRDRMKKAGINY